MLLFVSVPGETPWCSTVQFHLQHSSSSLCFLGVKVCSFPILQEWHLPLLHHTYQMGDVTGADEEKEEDESPIYHVSILSRWIIEKLVQLTRVARSCVCWLFFGRMSLCSPCCTIYLLHCLLGISLSICLSVCLLALARFSLLPPLKQSFLGCCDSHVILACCARQSPAPGAAYTSTKVQPGINTRLMQVWQASDAH